MLSGTLFFLAWNYDNEIYKKKIATSVSEAFKL